MKKPEINTSKSVVPMIYAYSTPEVARHYGWTKIGYTEQKVETRIGQQTDTVDVEWNLEWKGNAIFEDGSGKTFTDKAFHAYLRKLNYEQEKGKNNEWFHITGQESKIRFYDFKENHGITETAKVVIPYNLRDEQNDAVTMTVEYMDSHTNGEFLWNAKPRFGKTLSVYDFVNRIDAKTVLIVTNRPAIANSWFSDYETFFGTKSGYLFVSEVDALKEKQGVLSRKEYCDAILNPFAYDGAKKCIEFVSLQDLKGSIYFGGKFEKLEEVANMEWDVLVIDEAHEGVDTYKTDVAFNHIKRKFTLHLSGTPFKALANDKFNSDAIFNWTYADEQKKKHEWNDPDIENPYANLPQLNLYTYQMSEIIKDELQQGVEIQGETEEYAFDLNEFFRVNNAGRFVYDSSVNRFLDAMTTREKFPFSTEDLRDELNHTFWLLDRVDSARALAKKLEAHPIFKDYKVVLAAGDGKIDDDAEIQKSYDKVVKAIEENEKTITLSVGQLTTGITVPEWTAVLVLSNVKSPSLYMQTAFRAQNPCLFKKGTEYRRKQNSYVFDFDPARTLTIFEEFANDLYSSTTSGRGDIEERKKHIKELLNFFPVIGEDEDGELIELDAEKVLTIPRKIKSVEVVKRGFMSNFLFQNISNIFGAPKEVLDIIQQFDPVNEPKNGLNLPDEVKNDLSINEDGEVEVSDDIVIGQASEIFGEKIYDDTIASDIEAAVDDYKENNKTENQHIDELKELFTKEITEKVVNVAQDYYGNDMTKKDVKTIESNIKGAAGRKIEQIAADQRIKNNILESQKTQELQNRFTSGKSVEEIELEFDKKIADNEKEFKKNLSSAMDELLEKSSKDVVKTVETNKREREKKTIEDGVRDHLRGFSRTIPSFLMAYGENDVTLATFDDVVPDRVFKEVTSISLEQFRFLRDGGTYIDDETGEEKRFDGHLFDAVVFDDSVKEFLSLKKRLSNYFDEQSIEDIFDYIPPQKTNQIFTPKKVVKMMVDNLEKENPGCFDNPDKTFIDLYMKSGLYITEIVKRLYQSERLKELYPDKKDRLEHIFEKQVYGLAPTEIIYKIAISYILGFEDDVKITKHNFRNLDALPYAKDNTLSQKLDEIYGGSISSDY